MRRRSRVSQSVVRAGDGYALQAKNEDISRQQFLDQLNTRLLVINTRFTSGLEASAPPTAFLNAINQQEKVNSLNIY